VTAAEFAAFCIGCCTGGFAFWFYYTYLRTIITAVAFDAPNFAVVDDGNVEQMSAGSSAIFSTGELDAQGRPTSICCGLTTIPETNEKAVIVVGGGYPKDEHALVLSNYLGEPLEILELADGLYIRVVKKSELGK